MPSQLEGYRGLALNILAAFKATVGDEVKLTTPSGTFHGILMPRSDLADDMHIVLKMKNGYNLGIRIDATSKLEVTGKGTAPTFQSPVPPSQDSKLPLVTILGTGGTIASRVDYRTGAVHPALTAEDLYGSVPELANIARVRAKVLFSEFSENLTTTHWSKLAEEAGRELKDGVSGVVIPHGTDTMGYTAAALSFALKKLPAPVILTAAQRSSDRPSSDAASNLIGSVGILEHAPFGEVVIAMHQSISDDVLAVHRGTRARKCHTTRRDTFRSVNAAPIAHYDLRSRAFTLNTEDYSPRSPPESLEVHSNFEPKVALVKFYPGMQPDMLSCMQSGGYRGLILEGTGLGHVARHLFGSVRDAIDAGIFVGMTSQCLWGSVDMFVYDTGRDLLNAGVTPLGDMLPETALVKLTWVLGQTREQTEVKRMMTANLAGEIGQRRYPESGQD